MILDARLIGTKCEHCTSARDLPLERNPPFPCCRCTDRPNRNRDKSEFVPDVNDEELRKELDEIAKQETKYDY